MKKQNKLTALVLAGMLAAGTVYPMGGTVFAEAVKSKAEGTGTAGLVIEGNAVDKELEQGDHFNIYLKVDASLVDKITYIGLTGSVNENFSPSEVQINGDGSIFILNLEYNGNGNSVAIEMDYEGMTNPATITIALPNAKPKVAAGEGIQVTQNAINVVTGERQQVAFSLMNNGKATTQQGKMTFELEDKKASQGIVIKTKEVSIPELGKGESKDFTFVADIDEKVTRGIHKIKVKIADKDGKNAVEKTLQLKVDSDFMPPSLELSVNNTTGFQAGKPQNIQVNVKNVGHVAAKNVKVELVPNEKIIVTDGSNVRYINNVGSGKTEKLSVGLQVVDNSASMIPQQIKLSYSDDLGKTQEETQTIYINTQATAFAKEISIEGIKEPSGIHKVGETFNVAFNVVAEDGAKNVTVSVKGAEGIVPKSKNMFVINELPKGGKQGFNVQFTAGKDVVTGTHLIEIQAKYRLNNEDVTMSQYATVSIDNPEKEEGEEGEAKGKPKVIIGNYASQPVIVKAGEQFELQLGFLNTNNKKSVHNLKANITVNEEGEKNTGSVFTPVNASNTFFIQDMAPGELVMKDITLYTIPSAMPKTYEITIEMEYEDEEGNAITAKENIGIPVEQVTKLEIADVQVDTVEVGMEAYMTARIYNTGKTNISNVKITTVGEGFTVQENMMFIGVMEKGATESYEPVIIPNQGGTLQGQILVEYEDVAGVVQTLVHDFEMEVMEPMVFPEGGMNPGFEEVLPPVEEKKNPWPLLGGIGVGTLVAAGITALVLKKRRKKQEELGFDED
ncbi:MAG: COG1361 S-layer family protein [Cellulosilyticaceae bacterium]